MSFYEPTPNLQQRLEAIANVEKKIDELLLNAQSCISELTKDKQISKQKMEESSQSFRRTLNTIESELGAQLQYLAHVCVGAAHQGSTFASEKNTALAECTVRDLHEELQRLVGKHFCSEPAEQNQGESGNQPSTSS
ncbi:hypothetical protein WR25_12963 [Diploscapter pachys]|uniref:Mediator of RNA polymerase II transcription subunit 11 n=1 Tax=Diploscapter pachys TaxID=2018661 RepID=A0A2A2K310_9BILA|nr:hypothetical protein WR25_12963 [Diploscapter pachys]